MKRKAETTVSDMVRLMAPETLALVRAINSDRSTRDSYAGYLNALAQCDTVFERTCLALCMAECREVNETGLRAAMHILGPDSFLVKRKGV